MYKTSSVANRATCVYRFPVRREVAQHTVERSVRKIIPNERIRFAPIYSNAFPTAVLKPRGYR